MARKSPNTDTNDRFKEIVGDVLCEARNAAGMTQEELGGKSGVDRAYISELEHGKNSVSIEVLFRLCSAMGVSCSEVVAAIEKKKPPLPSKRKQR